MRCLSCTIEIDPKWKHAIENNICPFCGSSIIENELKNLLSILHQALDDLHRLKYSEQLDDWMLSNFNYIKTTSPQLIDYVPKEVLKDLKKFHDDKDFEKKKFIVKVKNEQGIEEEISAEKIHSDEQVNSFYKRAQNIKENSNKPFESLAEKTNHLKSMVQQVKKAANSSGLTTISAEVLEEADPQAVEEYESLISGESVMPSLDNIEEDIPSHVLSANMALAGPKNSSYNAKDMLKLQQMYNRINKSKEDFESGANRGKGGFSRS